MDQAIIIATTPDRYIWLNNCLSSISGYDKYPILILSDYTYFYGKMRFLIGMTEIKEFVMIPDSMEIKKTDLFDMLFSYKENVSFTKTIPYPFWMSLGKFNTHQLSYCDIPEVKTKEEELKEEVRLANELLSYPYTGLFDNLSFDSKNPNPITGKVARIQEKCGRNNLVIENEYFVKYQRI